MKRLLIILTALLLAACARSGVTQAHIDGANELCAMNGGISVIEDAKYVGEIESCGFRCSRQSGKIVFTAAVMCGNGAKFDLDIRKWRNDEVPR